MSCTKSPLRSAGSMRFTIAVPMHCAKKKRSGSAKIESHTRHVSFNSNSRENSVVSHRIAYNCGFNSISSYLSLLLFVPTNQSYTAGTFRSIMLSNRFSVPCLRLIHRSDPHSPSDVESMCLMYKFCSSLASVLNAKKVSASTSMETSRSKTSSAKT